MSEIDTKYLKEKNVAALLETLAAEIVIQRPNDPEAFLRDRFSDGKEDTFKPSDAITLYVTMLSPVSAVALLALSNAKHNNQITGYDVSEINDGTPIPSDFHSTSPFQRLPALNHNGVGVVEAGAITKYVCSRTSAFPVTPARQRARVDSLFETIQHLVLSEATAAVEERVFAPRKHQRPADNISVQASATRFRAALSQLQSAAHLFEDSVWVVGSAVSIADIILAAAVFSMHHVAGFDCVSGLEKLSKWWTAVQQEVFFVEGIRPLQAAAAKLYSR